MGPWHPDFSILSEIAKDIRVRVPKLAERYPDLTLDALEFVLDPVRTGRTRLSDLDNVEKTFIGLKLEHFLRDLLDAPKGVRDLELAGHNVDVKNTVSESWSWMIPPETYRNEEPCLLAAINDARRLVWLGLIVARPAYLTNGKNRDGKLGIRTAARANILWLVEGVPLPRDRWEGIDMKVFRKLREVKPGTLRAAQFFAGHLRRPVHRSIVQSLLYDQHDYMKRLRGNGGAKDLLRPYGVALLSGMYHNKILEELGLGRIRKDEHIAVDARTPTETAILRTYKEL